MSARQKLNAALFTGAILIGGLIAAATGSSGWGLLTALGLLVAGLHDGTFRSRPDSRPPRSRRSRQR